MLCTPDRIAYTHDGSVELVEIKTDEGGKWGKPGDENPIPQHHYLQLFQQAAIFGARRAHLVRFAHKQITEYRFDFDWSSDKEKVLLNTIVLEADEFLASLINNEEPPPDGHKATTDTLKNLLPGIDPEIPPVPIPQGTVEEYEYWNEQKRYVKQRCAEVENKLRHRLGRATSGIDAFGNIFVTRTVYKRRGYEVQPTVVDQLRRKVRNDGDD